MTMPKDSSQPHPRPRRPRGSLTPAGILDAAEAIAAGDGFGALSMRAVAAGLGAAPMALYNHFATRDVIAGASNDGAGRCVRRVRLCHRIGIRARGQRTRR